MPTPAEVVQIKRANSRQDRASRLQQPGATSPTEGLTAKPAGEIVKGTTTLNDCCIEEKLKEISLAFKSAGVELPKDFDGDFSNYTKAELKALGQKLVDTLGKEPVLEAINWNATDKIDIPKEKLESITELFSDLKKGNFQSAAGDTSKTSESPSNQSIQTEASTNNSTEKVPESKTESPPAPLAESSPSTSLDNQATHTDTTAAAQEPRMQVTQTLKSDAIESNSQKLVTTSNDNLILQSNEPLITEVSGLRKEKIPTVNEQAKPDNTLSYQSEYSSTKRDVDVNPQATQTITNNIEPQKSAPQINYEQTRPTPSEVPKQPPADKVLVTEITPKIRQAEQATNQIKPDPKIRVEQTALVKTRPTLRDQIQTKNVAPQSTSITTTQRIINIQTDLIKAVLTLRPGQSTQSIATLRQVINVQLIRPMMQIVLNPALIQNDSKLKLQVLSSIKAIEEKSVKAVLTIDSIRQKLLQDRILRQTLRVERISATSKSTNVNKNVLSTKERIQLKTALVINVSYLKAVQIVSKNPQLVASLVQKEVPLEKVIAAVQAKLIASNIDGLRNKLSNLNKQIELLRAQNQSDQTKLQIDRLTRQQRIMMQYLQNIEDELSKLMSQFELATLDDDSFLILVKRKPRYHTSAKRNKRKKPSPILTTVPVDEVDSKDVFAKVSSNKTNLAQATERSSATSQSPAKSTSAVVTKKSGPSQTLDIFLAEAASDTQLPQDVDT